MTRVLFGCFTDLICGVSVLLAQCYRRKVLLLQLSPILYLGHLSLRAALLMLRIFLLLPLSPLTAGAQTLSGDQASYHLHSTKLFA